MPIFKLEKSEGDDISKAELVIAQETNLELEKHLENWLENSPRALTQEPLLWIGRQTSASVDEHTIFPDLLGVDIEGNLIIVELKRDKAPREVIAQLLEYAAWAGELSESQIREIAETYFKTRDEFEGKTFDEAFREVFDLPETDELPRLNEHLRLFIVPEDISSRIERVCRFLRTSHRMDISCISVSTFQTDSNERIISMEARIGGEQLNTSRSQRHSVIQTSRWSEDKSTQEVLRDAIKELTRGDFNVVFKQKDILEKYPNFNANTLRRVIIEDCANGPSPNDNSIINPDGKYWWVARGEYRLYNPETDKMQRDDK